MSDSQVPLLPGRSPSETLRSADVRFGSATDALTPMSVAERSLAAGARQWAGLVLVACAGVVADQVTKRLVTSRLDLGDEVTLTGPFSIYHVENSGIAFGFFAGATSVVVALTAIAVGSMLVFFARSGARHPVLPVGLGLVVGGSLSNLADRARFGHVTDFLHVQFWPAFNLADTFIVVGVTVLIVSLLTAEREPRRPRRPSGGAVVGL